MEWMFALKPQEQMARLGHLSRIIFDDIPRFQRLTDFLRRYSALKHTLDCMNSEDDPVTFHRKIILCKMNIRQK